MIHVVAAIYVALGVLLTALTYVDVYGGPQWSEWLGLLFIILGVILHVIGWQVKTEQKNNG